MTRLRSWMRAVLRAMRTRARAARGEGAVEFAVIAGPLFVFTFLVVQAGLVLYARSVALGAATQADSAARAYQSNTGAGIDKANQFLDRAGGGLLRDTQVTVTSDAGGITVTVSGHAPSLIPGVSFPISQSAIGPQEGWIAP